MVPYRSVQRVPRKIAPRVSSTGGVSTRQSRGPDNIVNEGPGVPEAPAAQFPAAGSRQRYGLLAELLAIASVEMAWAGTLTESPVCTVRMDRTQ
jgi:hypothetical protein